MPAGDQAAVTEGEGNVHPRHVVAVPAVGLGDGTVCIGSPNGCALPLPGGSGVLFFEDGDSFTSAFGQTWTCRHGKWVVSLTRPASRILTPVSGKSLPTP
jgi:hypothetical protein